MSSRRKFFKTLAVATAVMPFVPAALASIPKPATGLNLDDLFRQMYAIKRQREQDGEVDFLILAGSHEEAEKIRKMIVDSMVRYYQKKYANRAIPVQRSRPKRPKRSTFKSTTKGIYQQLMECAA